MFAYLQKNKRILDFNVLYSLLLIDPILKGSQTLKTKKVK